MRVQVNINDEIVSKIDKLAKSYGVSRSALISVWVGQVVAGFETVNDAAKDAVLKQTDNVK